MGDGYTYTLEEVGRIFKVTRERVRQIEAKAVRKLQNPVRSQTLEGFVPEFPLHDSRVEDKEVEDVESPAAVAEDQKTDFPETGSGNSFEDSFPQFAPSEGTQSLFNFDNREMDHLFTGTSLN